MFSFSVHGADARSIKRADPVKFIFWLKMGLFAVEPVLNKIFILPYFYLSMFFSLFSWTKNKEFLYIGSKWANFRASCFGSFSFIEWSVAQKDLSLWFMSKIMFWEYIPSLSLLTLPRNNSVIYE